METKNLTAHAASLLGLAPPPLSTLDYSPSASEAWTPFYHYPHESLLPFLSDKYTSLVGPVVIYWLISLWFTFLDWAELPFFEKYRLHENEEVKRRNKVPPTTVVAMVVLQQVVQTALGAFVLEDDETARRQVFADHQAAMRTIGVHLAKVVCGTVGYKTGLRILGGGVGVQAVQWLYWWALPFAQFWWAFFVMDAWQYALHRAFHESRFLYRHFHSHHHRLYVPYAFGALYNHPLEGLLLDSAGGAVSHALALMTVRQGILLFTFSTLKTVCDHGGYAFPWWLDPLHLIFPNCAEYHDVHHQMQGLRYNYSQPFFVHFDVLFGTRIGVEKFDKMKAASRKIREEIREARKGVVRAVGGQKSAHEDKAVVDGSATTTLRSTASERAEFLRRRQAGITATGSRSVGEGSQSGSSDDATLLDASYDDDVHLVEKLLQDRGAIKGQERSAEEIVGGEENPFVTTNMDSYREKAGNSLL